MKSIIQWLKYYLHFNGKKKKETKENSYLQNMQNTVNTENTVPRKRKIIVIHLKSFPPREIKLGFDFIFPFFKIKKKNTSLNI